MIDKAALLFVLVLLPLAAAHGDEAHADPAWSSPILYAGESYSQSFDEVGPHGYHDGANDATGVVTVVEAAATSAEVTVTDTGLEPANVEVAPGGTVTWTLAADAAGWHNIVSDEEAVAEPAGEDSPGLALPMLAAGLLVLARRR